MNLTKLRNESWRAKHANRDAFIDVAYHTQLGKKTVIDFMKARSEPTPRTINRMQKYVQNSKGAGDETGEDS